jgi:hypothetical protein
MEALESQYRPAVILASACLVLLLVAAMWRTPPDQAALLGVVAVFALLLTTCYYWSMLLLLPARKGAAAVAGLLALNVVLYGADLAGAATSSLYGLMSLGLLVFFLFWVVGTLRQGRRERH